MLKQMRYSDWLSYCTLSAISINFTVVYYEPVNLIGYIIVFYLLIKTVARVIVHVILFLHASVHNTGQV